MSRVSTFLLLVGLMLLMSVVPAGAGVENNPNAFRGGNVICDDVPMEPGSLIATGQAGHDGVNPGVVGVALYVEITNLGPEPVPIFGSSPLNRGLAKVTTWCTWQGEGFDFRGRVLLR